MLLLKKVASRLMCACQVIVDEIVKAGLVLEKDAKQALKGKESKRKENCTVKSTFLCLENVRKELAEKGRGKFRSAVPYDASLQNGEKSEEELKGKSEFTNLHSSIL